MEWERALDEGSKAFVDEAYARFMENRRGKGAVYEALCRQLAEAEVRRRRLVETGRDVTTEEHLRMGQHALHLIAQLQRHTEATKSESLTKEAQELALALLGVLEGVIAPVNPKLLQPAAPAPGRTDESPTAADGAATGRGYTRLACPGCASIP